MMLWGIYWGNPIGQLEKETPALIPQIMWTGIKQKVI